MDNADKLTETEMLKLQVANLQVDNANKALAIANHASATLADELRKKYGLPMDKPLQWQNDGTIMRAPKLVPTEQEVSGG